MIQFTFSIEEIDEIAKQVLNQKPNKIILFNGEMGAGKTTFIKALCKTLGVENATSSPTFSLVNEYQTVKNELVYHFDMYRLKNQEEALDMGIDDYLFSNHWCLIEWSEKIINLIPENHSTIKISIVEDNKRKLEMY
jgi:tRNA threonylcarbamoyladenosine biosynthesis protein TsaE